MGKADTFVPVTLENGCLHEIAGLTYSANKKII